MRHRYQRGQLLPIAVIAFVVLVGIAGLAIDSSRNYLVKRDAQNAADFGTLAAAKQMASYSRLTSAISSGSNPVKAAHDFTSNNGFSTIYNTTCDQSNGSAFTTSWFDSSGFSCSATAGFVNKVTVNDPPVPLPGASIPPACSGAGLYTCIQVVITTKVSEFFTAVLGISQVYVTVSATAHAELPGSSFNAPPPNAINVFEPQPDNCGPNSGSRQCFNESTPVSRTLLSCAPGGTPGGTASNNCPTVWIKSGTNPDIYGYDGSLFSPAQDVPTLISNGDLIFQDRTTLCDPYNGATCAHQLVTGPDGLAMAPGSNIYCSKFGTGASHSDNCSTSGQSTLNEVDGNEGSFFAPAQWFPTVDTSNLQACGGLILNGGPVPPPCNSSGEPYVIEPGVYSYIVINHGTYEFDSGLYDITSTAPVNSPGNYSGAYTATGIDHSKEAAGDFDLCSSNQTTCSLTAGVWIGHGGGAYGAYVAPTAGTCAGGSTGNSGGGGDATNVNGSGVTFRMESGSGGFVVTHEVAGVSLASPGVQQLQSVGGTPLLIDEENNSFIHLDAAAASDNNLSGIIYQNMNATGGGVEVNLGMNNSAGGATPAIGGQVVAYSFTTFGQKGRLNFQGGYGTGATPAIATSGKNETSIINSVSLSSSAPGYETLNVNYTDEWWLDGYDAYVKVNNGVPIFFSQGIWNTTPGPSDPIPPPLNNPGDQYPAYPTSSNSANYTINPSNATDWTYAIPSSGGSTIEMIGSWMWGHQSDLTGANSGSYVAQMKYTFPTPDGTYVAISMFLSDGDHCGDYALASYSFKNVGAPGGGGLQTIGSVTLVQ